MNKKIIHITIPQAPSVLQLDAIQRAKELHPAWEIMTWQDPVSSHGMHLGSYYVKARSGSQLADLIRLDAVYRHGGIYIDSDIKLLKPLDGLISMSNIFCSEDGFRLTNAVFGASPRSPVIRKLIDYLLANEPDWSQPPCETTGPAFFSRVLQWDNSINLLPRDTFYPYNWNQRPEDPKCTSIGIHLWAASWKDSVDQECPNGSILQTVLLSNVLGNIMPRIKSWIKIKIRKRLDPFFFRLERALDRRPLGHAYVSQGDLVANTSRNILISLSGIDLSITPEVVFTGTYEESELLLIEKLVNGGDFVVDIGCNVGMHTLVAARRVGPFGRVIAVDPNPIVHDHLSKSLIMNWCHERVKMIEAAAGSSDEPLILNFSPYCLGGANLGLGPESCYGQTLSHMKGNSTRQVSQLQVDSLVNPSLELKLLKIDVEGFEYHVLDGCSQLIANRSIGYILMELVAEVAGDLYKSNLLAIEKIIKNGYSLFGLALDGSLYPIGTIDELVGRHQRNIVLARDPIYN